MLVVYPVVNNVNNSLNVSAFEHVIILVMVGELQMHSTYVVKANVVDKSLILLSVNLCANSELPMNCAAITLNTSSMSLSAL